MTDRAMFIAFLFLASTSFADSSTQTDWSGSSGVWGPVLELGIDFYSDSGTNPWGYPGNLALGYVDDIKEHEVVLGYEGAWTVRGTDMDGDGDVDILGGAYTDHQVDWWENLDGEGTSWLIHSIDAYFSVDTVRPIDIDGDGDIDVVGIGEDSVLVWKNLDGIGTVWEQFVVNGAYDSAVTTDCGDFDGDGDADIVSSSTWLDRHSWFENMDGSGENWQEHVIDQGITGFQWVVSVDMDEDGDQDVLKTGDWSIGWYENTDGSGMNWVKHTIREDWVGICIQPSDVDGDGDIDVICCHTSATPQVCWFENDGMGLMWKMHAIDNNALGAQAVWPEDFDRDGDVDVAGAITNQIYKKIVWWENLDGVGLTWGIHVVDPDFYNPMDIHTADVNGDGEWDLIGAGAQSIGNRICWWHILSHPDWGGLESSVLYTQGSPLWNDITWSSNEPEGTQVGFQVRASAFADSMEFTDWSDTLWSPASLQGILDDGDAYVQYRVFLKTTDSDTTPVLHEVTLSWDPLGTGDHEPDLFELLPVVPNPGMGTVTLRFTLPISSPVELSVYDIAGRCEFKLPEAVYGPGVHAVSIGDLVPGVYFCRMETEGYRGGNRFVVIR